MLTAPELDDWTDPELPRIADPELRSRLVGYLSHAPAVGDGYRGDGVWAWPQSLADQVRSSGVGPCEPLLNHVAAQGFLLRPETSGGQPDLSTAPSVGDGGVAAYLAVTETGELEPSDLVRVAPPAAHGTVVAGGSWLTTTGWCGPVEPPTGVARRPVSAREVSPLIAGGLADRLARHWYDDMRTRARESAGSTGGPRPARVFDANLADGRPAFSPERRRIVEPERRERLIHYLRHARMVLRAAGMMADPTTGDPAPVVPLSFRTDGTWVWSEAVPYYVSRRGVAPELEFLNHIEERAYQLPASVPDDVARAAAAVAQQQVAGWSRRSPRYAISTTGVLLRRWNGNDRAEVLDDSLRWRRCFGDWRPPWSELIEITEADASREIDTRWARATS
jgi:hypothetical protein